MLTPDETWQKACKIVGILNEPRGRDGGIKMLEWLVIRYGSLDAVIDAFSDTFKDGVIRDTHDALAVAVCVTQKPEDRR